MPMPPPGQGVPIPGQTTPGQTTSGTTIPGLTIRPVRRTDEAAWRDLWAGYLRYYETALPEEVYRTTFARLLAGGNGEFRGLVALIDGVPVGLVHYVFHPSSWRPEGVCYLQDLYTAPAARGRGVARALIEAVYAAGDAAGVPGVYWFTQDFNATARRLYDQVGTLTPFIRYNRRFATGAALPEGAVIRPLRSADAADWHRLWAGYLTFYEARLPESTTAATFAQVTSDDPAAMRCLVMEREGRLVGLVHHVAHRTCWKLENIVYLQDLFADPAHRGQGIGAALIGAVYAVADRQGTPMVYWLTQHFNATARRLYDSIGLPTPFIEYDRPE